MITITDAEVYGWEPAIKGARNPLNSWDKSDSGYYGEDGNFVIGDNDKKLLTKLAQAGTDHGKFMRMIHVSCDINAPLYWWKQFDTYRAGVEKNSCSTMHKIHAKEFTFGDFSTEKLDDDGLIIMTDIINQLNVYRAKFNETKDKQAWYCMVQLLPDAYNQTRTVQMSYAAIRAMYHARKDHKLDEWHEFCDWAKALPMAAELIVG